MKRHIEIDIWEGCPEDKDARDAIFEREFERILPMVAEGYLGGQVYGEEPAYAGWWTAAESEINETKNALNEAVTMLADLKRGYAWDELGFAGSDYDEWLAKAKKLSDWQDDDAVAAEAAEIAKEI